MANEVNNGYYKLSWGQRIGFGSGDLAQNLIFQTVACFLMLYLCTVLKINPGFVSGLILAVRLLDCFWSPVVGKYIDNHNPKLGKYRTYLLYGGIPLTVAACFLMLPAVATWGMTWKIVYATVSYTLLSMIYSVVNIPYGSIMAHHPAFTARFKETVWQEGSLLPASLCRSGRFHHPVHHR